MATHRPGKLTSVWNYDFSRLRILACFAVVCIHTFLYARLGAGVYGYAMSPADLGWDRVIENGLMWAVPVFVMITGALLLDPSREISLRHIYTKYVSRVGGALLLFGLIFLFIDMGMGDRPATGMGFLQGIGDLLTGHSWSHMWYLYMLLGLYILLPFFRMVTKEATHTEIRYLIGVLFVFNSLLPLLGIWGIETDYRFSVATVYPLYLFLGYALHEEIIKVPRWASWLLLTVTAVSVILIDLFAGEDILPFFASYNSFLMILLSSAVFLVGTHGTGSVRVPRTSFFDSLLRSLDRCSFGIYLVHMIFLKLTLRTLGWNPFGNAWIFLGLILGNFLVSYGITWVFTKIPGLKKIV